MYQNLQFRIAWRHLMKDRQSAILNFIGLSTGLACTVLIFLWVRDERRMDSSQDPNIFQVMENRLKSGGIWTSPTTSGPMSETMQADFPEIAFAVPTRRSGNITLTAGEKNIKSDGIRAGKDFFQVFNYPLLAGNKTTVLAAKQDIVLSDVLAERLFGSVANAMGKSLDWQHEEQYRISGIFKTPDNHQSNLFDFVLSIQSQYENQQSMREWGNTGLYTYVRLKAGTDPGQFNRKIAGFVKSKTGGAITHRTPFIFRYADLYLHGNFENGISSGGRISYVNLFSIIAIFILVIACINFINLSTARAARRAKEVGIKKVVGASRSSLVFQYLGESMMVTLLSLLLAILLVVLLLPAFNDITGKSLRLEMDGTFAATLVGLAIFTGVIAGSYPAVYLSGFNPGLVLKGKRGAAGGERMARKGLVIFQFTLSVVLIVSVLAVYRQIQFMQNRNLGFNRENILTLPIEGKLGDVSTARTFLDELRKVPGVIHASGIGHNLTGHNSGTSGVKWPGRDPADKTEFENIAGDYDLIETLSIQIKEGRSFSKNFGADTSAIIFNEAAIAYMDMKDPIGKTVTLWGEPRNIIGVVKDFHYESLHKAITPVFFRLSPEDNYQFLASVQPGKEKAVIDQVSAIHTRFNPGFAYEYNFLDERFKTMYVAEQRVAVLSRYFAGLAILISCLGLFGLAAYTAQSRQKEIAIRKVIGATIENIVLMLSGDFLKLILVALVIACPLSWWAVTKWMDGFAYHAPIGYGIFVIAGISILVITFATISFQSLKAALANPAGSLKSE
ncbi:MAG: ABC transporter permease [Bacteroidota bacterium]